jgi:hypothetical protein
VRQGDTSFLKALHVRFNFVDDEPPKDFRA